MKLAGEVATFEFLNLQQPSRKLLQTGGGAGELGLLLLEGGDVDLRAVQANWPSRFVDLEICVQHEPAPAAVLVAHPVLDRKIRPRIREILLDHGLQLCEIIGVAVRNPFGGIVADFVFGKTDLRLPPVGKMGARGADIPRPQADAAGLESEVQLLLTLA